MNPRRRSGRVVRFLLWGGLGAWALVLGIVYLTRDPRKVPEPGAQVLRAGDVGRSVGGADLALLAGDSMVAVLAATSECPACRIGVPAYRDLAARLKKEGVALRVIVGSDTVAARQFARLLPEPGSVVIDPRQKIFRSIGFVSVPSLYLVGSDGRVLKTWVPLSPDPRVVEVVAGEAMAAKTAK